MIIISFFLFGDNVVLCICYHVDFASHRTFFNSTISSFTIITVARH